MQESFLGQCGPTDRLVHVCGPGDLADPGIQRLQNAFEVPEVPDSQHNLSQCMEHRFWERPPRAPCSGHRKSQIKFVYGLVREVRRHLRCDLPKPRWWMVKDDDTYVHVNTLVDIIESYNGSGRAGMRRDRPPWRQLLSFVALGCGRDVCGGAGWVLSGALAEKLVGGHGDHYLRLAMGKIMSGKMGNFEGNYDMLTVPAMRFFDRAPRGEWATLVRLQEMMTFAPSTCAEMLPPEANPDRGCFRLHACNCSRTPRAATWHLKSSTFEQITLLDAEPSNRRA